MLSVSSHTYKGDHHLSINSSCQSSYEERRRQRKSRNPTKNFNISNEKQQQKEENIIKQGKREKEMKIDYKSFNVTSYVSLSEKNYHFFHHFYYLLWQKYTESLYYYWAHKFYCVSFFRGEASFVNNHLISSFPSSCLSSHTGHCRKVSEF